MAAFGANSSSSSSACSASKSCSQDYDVFINHRGPDIKHTFAKALYHNLEDRGVRAFLDESEMKVGEPIPSQLEDAIRGSTVHVALFTQNYATSNWPLDELCLMVKSAESRGTTIIPVFHGVKPAYLRWTDEDKSGPYAVALRQHEASQRYRTEEVQNWRNALSYVAKISGLDLAAFNKGGELELLREVVERVVRKVPKPPLSVAKYPIGLQPKVEEFTWKVLRGLREEEQAKVVVVGIVGSGGVGKTTLAKQFFNANRSIYHGSSFLFDVAKKSLESLESLQSRLIKQLKGRDIEIQSSDEGLGVLERNLSKCYALIVLDDIDHVDQLDAFLPIKNVLCPNSLLVVTSRDKQVLRNANIEESFIYHLKELNTEDSRKLFCRHAFKEPHIPPPEFNDVVDGLSKACHGLPLALKVIGSSLRGKINLSHWKGVLDGLDQTLPNDILKSLRVSYDSLEDYMKQIFLDIACFCVGEESDKWIKVWSGSGWQGLVGLETLQDKCLVELDTKNIIRMHDLLIHMGRNIAQQISLPIRKWRGTSREIFDLMEQSLYETIEVRGIRMVTPRTDDKEYRSKLEELLNSDLKFRIKKLQILEGAGDFVERMLKLKVLSTNLISLRWNDCRCSCLPSFSMQDLRVLEVNGKELGRLWEDEGQAPQQLLQLTIDAPLLELPKSLGKLRHLEKIVVKSTRLTTMPDSLRDLRNLQHIALVGCENLAMLPDSLENLTNLRHVDLSMCKSLRVLPDSMEKWTKLKFIDLHSCKNLEKLPNSLLEFPNIHCTPPIKSEDHDGCHINLSGFRCLKMLPDSLRYMIRLQTINLTGCESLKSLPDFLGELKYLERINLRLCKSLEMLPDSLKNLKYLCSINLSECESLKRLPASLGKLSLIDINLGFCKSLEMLPDSLKNLRDLYAIDLSGSKSLKRLPNSWGNRRLRHLHLKGCSSLAISSKTLKNLSNLECLDLSGSLQMELLPPRVGRQRFLKKLNLFNTNIKELHFDVLSFRNLEVLRLGSPLLEVLPASLGYLKNLTELWLHGCVKLQCLPDPIELLTQLRELNIQNCGIQSLPAGVMKMTELRKLAVHRCPLRELPFGKIEGEKGMILLDVLQLSGTEICEVSFPEGVCPDLQHLSITFCNDLVEVRALPTTLKSLDLRGCRALMKTGGLCDLGNLRTLNVRGCDNIQLEALQISSDCRLLNTPLDISDDNEEDVLSKVFCNYWW